MADSALRPVLEPIGRSLAAIDALGRIEARLLGAYREEDTRAMELQAREYRKDTGELVQAVTDAQANLAEQRATYDREPLFAPATQRELASVLLQVWREVRPSELVDAWRETEMPDLSELPWEDTPDLLARLDGLEAPLARATDELLAVARAVSAEPPPILVEVEKQLEGPAASTQEE